MDQINEAVDKDSIESKIDPIFYFISFANLKKYLYHYKLIDSVFDINYSILKFEPLKPYLDAKLDNFDT
jgi:hypothetical protein